MAAGGSWQGQSNSPRADGYSPRGVLDGFVSGESGRKAGAPPSAREQQQLIQALERHYAAELGRISPQWVCAGDGPGQPPIDVTDVVGVPNAVLGAILAGKCRDQQIPATAERQKRFADWLCHHCNSLWFTLHDFGVGSECAKGIVLALALNDRFTSLNLACNILGDAGAAAIARVLPEHQTLVNLDLSANDIGNAGATAILESLALNRSVTSLDLSSKPGSLKNRLARNNADALESLLLANPVLTKLSLVGTSLGADGVAGLARGLSGNTTLFSLDLASNDLGPRGAASLAEALVPSGLQELNLADNRMGDEGLSAIASKLGALPANPDSPGAAAAWTSSAEGIKASVKYHEAIATLRRAVADVTTSMLLIREDSNRQDALARLTGSAALLASAVEMASLPMCKLRVLLLGNNNATSVGVGRIEDALQVNRVLDRLVLDQCDHRGSDGGAKTLVTSLPINTNLRTLSLSQCRLGSAGVMDIAKSLAVNDVLEVLSLRGNQFGQEAAATLGAVLATGAKSLRQLNLSSCHLEDGAGVVIANGLVTNNTLEGLQLRDNCLRETSGRTLADVLRKQTSLTQLSLELNSIDFRFLAQINKSLDRNARLREQVKPQVYRQRIEKLLECQKEVKVLTSTLKRNQVVKRKTKIHQAAMMQELKDAQGEEQQRQQVLEEQLEEVRHARKLIDEEISQVEEKYRAVVSEGDYETTQLQLRISNVEDRLRHYEKHITVTKKQLAEFDAQASEELTGLHDEIERAEKARNSAQLLSGASQRNLDSFAASLKSMEEEMAGGADPRQRIIPPHVKENPKASETAKTEQTKRGSKEATSTRPRTPNKSAAGKASPRQPRLSGGPRDRPRSGSRGAGTDARSQAN